jgi:hypothetical protein
VFDLLNNHSGSGISLYMPASEQVTTVRVESEKGNEILNAF